ncbi:dicarboxylate/amino acid:cation symporter [Acetomicrobium sp. S15 = DSM 107314]|uniref:dicarboxylate/amino acid:cation symporter n=1 Tax=Acetomicrobium sp. S15 = DSM 107314 TaxID=2529858 RepID=UPI0018E0D8BF|nr:dicarboxylate/amino acid:cation symporter [Acetomicrobium sp. S15 = DSM 107314]
MAELDTVLRLGKRPLYILMGAVIGAVVGAIIGPEISVIKPFGDAFIYLLRFIVGPLILVSIAHSATVVEDYRRMGRVFGWFMAYWAIMGIIAAVIGYTTANIMKPGIGVALGEKEIQLAAVSVRDVILGWIPQNSIRPLLELNIVQVIIIALLVGFSVVLVKDVAPQESKFMKDFLASALAVIYKIVDIILWYAPIGVFALMGDLVGTIGGVGLAAVGKMVLTQWTAYLLIFIIVHPIVLLLILRVNPLTFWKKVYPAMITAFSTQSSSATLPVTLRVTKALGVPDDAANLILPIAATINMQAVAAEMPIYAVWAAQMYGAQLTVAHVVVALLMGVFGAAACAGVPGGGILIAAITLQTLGLPLAPVGWIAGIYVAIDVLNTTLNVTGDPLGVMVASKALGEFDRERFYAPIK